ncbi:50S ribosomal protein L35 [bacterium F11]|nr:50S ribosomal protein L35 [bacterium F11]
MPKLKSHSGSKKRFKISKNGKVRYKRSGARHLLQGMSSSRSRFFRRTDSLNQTQGKVIKRLLPYS